jgi:hypothetical protein
MSDKNKGASQENSILLISIYLFNYSSNFKLLKSLTQLGKCATQNHNQIQAKMPILIHFIVWEKSCSFRVSTLTAEHIWKSCAQIGSTGYYKPK